MKLILLYLSLAFVIILLPRYIRYKGSGYKVASGNSFFKTVFDKGNYGEFLTYNKLEKLNGYHKLMTNLYIPKADGSTTEIDLIMISETGIYVFESKNYSGWIFGSENHKNWTQSLPNKQKNKFFNPIWQNKSHISALKEVLGMNNDELFKSYIIFSERCTLKKIKVESNNVKVIKRDHLLKYTKKDLLESAKILHLEQMDTIYENLSQYCLVSESLKQAHINSIKLKNENRIH